MRKRILLIKTTMKKILLFTALSCFAFAGCEKDETEENPDPDKDELGEGTLSAYGSFDKHGVMVWEEESEIAFTDKYSLIDTVMQSRIIQRDVCFLWRDGQTEATVTWKLNGVAQSPTESNKRWLEGSNWLVTNTISLNIEKKTENVQIEAIVNFPDKAVRRFKTIPSIVAHKDVSDAWGLSFGSTINEIPDVFRRIVR